MPRQISWIALGCLFWSALGSVGEAADWNRFRGPNGTGSVEDAGVPVQFGEQDNLLWKVPLASGNSSPIVSQGRIFLQTANEDGSERRLRCLSLADGKELWARAITAKSAHTHAKSSLASCTGAADDRRVVMPFWDGTEISVHAFSLDGEPQWSHRLGSFTSQHGAGHSPILVDGKVILSNDQDGTAEIVALDAETGAVIWKTPRTPTRANYATPVLVERVAGIPEILIAGTPGAATYDLRSGSETWKWVWKSNTKQLRAVGSPVVIDGLVVFSGGNGPGDRQVAAVKLSGQGDVTETNLAWETHKLFPYVPCMLTRGEHIYFVNDAGVAACYVGKTGEQVWSRRLGEGTFYSSPVMAAGRIYAAAENGTVFVFSAAKQFELLATNQLDDSVIASPAVVDGRLLIRGKQNLYCFGTR